jgi:integrase
LNSPAGSKVLNWGLVKLPEGEVLDAFRCFVVHQIKTLSVWTTYNTFNRALILLHTPSAMQAAATGSTIPYLAFSEARAALGPKQSWKLHEGRMLYRWCRRQRFDQFSVDVEDMANRLVLGGNPKGRSVRSLDPDKGPLTVQEVASVVSALKAHRLRGTIPILEQAAVILCLALGSNASQFAALREEDLMPIRVDGETTGYILSVPRHKKGHRRVRAAFRRRKLNTFMGGIINDLCTSNRSEPHPCDNFSRPLFRRQTPGHVRGNLEEEWLYHYSGQEFTELLQRAIARLGVKGRDGTPLKVTTRRMRYTFATRMVNNGASRAAVADALDHSDLQHVPVYWDVHSDIVEHLDRAVAMALAPRAQALSGIVRSESDAVRGDEKGSRRHLADPAAGKFEPIGNCGSFSFCNIIAPYACYTCVKFQAWMDGPHEDVLGQLLRAREWRADQGLDPNIVGIEDELIWAVANTIYRIEVIRRQEAAAND